MKHERLSRSQLQLACHSRSQAQRARHVPGSSYTVSIHALAKLFLACGVSRLAAAVAAALAAFEADDGVNTGGKAWGVSGVWMRR